MNLFFEKILIVLSFPLWGTHIAISKIKNLYRFNFKMTDEEKVIKLQNDIAIKLWHKNYHIEARTKIQAEIERFKTEALLDEIIGNKNKDAEK